MKRKAESKVILCADDYGLSPGVGEGIRALLDQGRLSATSCMTVFPWWRDEASRLGARIHHADVGLHLTLTDQMASSPSPTLAPDGRFPSLGTLMKRAYTGALAARDVADELERQLDAFENALGCAPAFIDGHQHVQQLPVVRDAVLAAAAKRPGTWVRVCTEPLPGILSRRVAVPKTALISALGRPLERAARRAGIPANRRFRGVYDFSGRIPFGDLLAAFLDKAEDGLLVMLHPGRPDAVLRGLDPVVDQRLVEYETLAGDRFGARLAALGVRPSRLRDALA